MPERGERPWVAPRGEPALGQVVRLEVRLHLSLYQTLKEHNAWQWETWGATPRKVSEVLESLEQCPILEWPVKVVHVREDGGAWAFWVWTDPPAGTPAVRLGRLVPPGDPR